MPFHLDGQEVFTAASIGIALSTTGYDNSEDVLRDADLAMYRAKVRERQAIRYLTLTCTLGSSTAATGNRS
ncbi:MAG: hypothetical protein CLLPBCKN_003868 [Chroococcidiopsis cubana SAG 39.79]|nr:hypothetical protein [Chroococcidiopsis cubana SAG 39.79]